MATAREFWRPIINDFNPVGQVRLEDIIRFFVDRKEDDPTRSLVQIFQLNFQNSIGQPKPHKALLTGHVGSGKSSELIRLGQELQHDFFVVRFDADSTLVPDTTNHFEVLLGMGIAVHIAAEAAGLKPDKRLADNLLKSLANFVRKYEDRKGFSLRLDQLLKSVVAMALGAFGGLPTKLTADAILADTRLELNVRDDLVRTLELPANRQKVLGALNRIIEGAQEKAGKPLLIIADGLDKVPAARARKLFAESTLLTEPACALVYAAPIEFYHRLTAGQATSLFDEYKMLPNPPVYKRPLTGDNWVEERGPNRNGVKVMRKVVAKRLEARGKTVDEIITPEALELLARTSGGVMRELVRYVRDAATKAQALGKMQIDVAIAQNVINQQRQEIAPRLNIDHRTALRRVLQQGALSGGQHEAVEDDLLHSLHLLSYEGDNDQFWFDAHPNVLPLL